MLLKVLRECQCDSFNIMAIGNTETKANKMAKLAGFLVYEVHETDAQLFIMKVVELIKATNILHINSKENMWQIILKESNNNLFEQILKNDSENFEYYEKSLVQGLGFDVLIRVVREIFKYDNDKMTKKDQEIETKLTDEDQQIIHYVAGYIIFALTKKYKHLCENSKNFGAKDILLFLGTLKVKTIEEFSGENFLKFIERWTSHVNRVGLVRINLNFVIFIRRVGTVVQKILTLDFLRRYHGEDLRNHLKDKLQNNHFVTLVWQTLYRYFPKSKFSEALLNQIIEKWIDIRRKSYVKTLMQVLKRKLNKLGTKNKKENKRFHLPNFHYVKHCFEHILCYCISHISTHLELFFPVVTP